MAALVPWVIGGSKHSANLFRRTLQQWRGARSGVDRPGDFKVQALSVPGPGFRVAPGGGVAQSRDTAASARESYGPIIDSQLVVDSVPGTGSSGARRDLVILEITDPGMQSVVYPAPSSPAGWQDGSNFVRITVIPNVDSLVPVAQRPVKSLDQITAGQYANVTGITLAAINWPASTATITNAMIEDLRVTSTEVLSVAQMTLDLVDGDRQTLSNSTAYPGGQTWPAAAETAWGEIPIPADATHVLIRMTWSQFAVKGNANGSVWVQMGGYVHPDNQKTKARAFNSAAVSNDEQRQMVVAWGELKVPKSMRGTAQKFYPRGQVAPGVPAASYPWVDKYTGMGLELTFLQRAE